MDNLSVESRPVSRDVGEGRTGTPEGCKAGVDTGGFTPNQWLTAYGIDKLHAKGITGKGIRVAIINPNPWHKEALKTYTDCFSIPDPKAHIVQFPFEKPFSYVEAEMDIELIITAAPDLERVTTFSGVENEGPTLVYVHAAVLDASLMGNTLPHVVSSSGGNCETSSFTKEEFALLEHLFMAGCAAGNKGELYIADGKYEQAVQTYQKDLASTTGNARDRSRYGHALLKTSRIDESIIQFKKALELEPGEPYAILYLGMAYLNQGEFDQAAQTWKTYRNEEMELVE